MKKRYSLWFQAVLAFLLFAGLLGAQGTREAVNKSIFQHGSFRFDRFF